MEGTLQFVINEAFLDQSGMLISLCIGKCPNAATCHLVHWMLNTPNARSLMDPNLKSKQTQTPFTIHLKRNIPKSISHSRQEKKPEVRGISFKKMIPSTDISDTNEVYIGYMPLLYMHV